MEWFGRLKVVGLLICLLVAASGCAGSSTKSEGPKEKTADEVVVGVTLQDLSNEFIAMYAKVLEKEAKKYPGLKLIINDAQGRAELQASQVESFISQKVDAIIICPRDAHALIPAAKDVIKAGIPLICLGALLAEEVGQVYVGTRNPAGGRMQAEYIVNRLGGKGNVALLRGPLGCSAEIGRFQGLKEVFDKYPDIKIVFDQPGNWSREEGMRLMENWLQTGKRIDAVASQNDEMALGALTAIEAKGLLGKIIVAGTDGIPDALNAIKQGKLDATCFQDGVAHAKAALERAVRAARGEKISEMDIPWELVTKDNVDQYYERLKF